MLDILRPPLIAIDVGTATTRICWGSGEIHERPSVTCETVHGRTMVRRVMRGGVVADVSGVADVVRAYCNALPPPLSVSLQDLEALLGPVLDAIASFVATTLHNLPDAIAAEVIESGLHVTGGGAKLRRLVRRIEARSGLSVNCPDDPRNAVIRGAREMLRNRSAGKIV